MGRLSVSSRIIHVFFGLCLIILFLKDETDYILKDKIGEEKYKFKLSEALLRARRKGILDRKNIYCLALPNQVATLIRRIVRCSGGKVYYIRYHLIGN